MEGARGPLLSFLGGSLFKNPEARDAKHGEKMIEIRVRLWTDDLAGTKGQVVPKHAWSAGVVLMERNESHGIKPVEPIPFNSFAELPAKIERLLIAQQVKLHPSSRERKYITP